jgi:hypothetical protein
MATSTSPFKDLFIPQKNQPYSQKMFMANMLAIENWANALVKSIAANQVEQVALGFITIGTTPPAGTILKTLAGSYPTTATGGGASVPISPALAYGYTAVVCSGDDTLGCNVVDVNEVGSGLTSLAVECYSTVTGAITGTVVVSYIIIGA